MTQQCPPSFIWDPGLNQCVRKWEVEGAGEELSNPDIFIVAREFVSHGYNVIFVNEIKQPVGISEYDRYYDSPMSEDYINEYATKVKGRATGIALLGSWNPRYPEYKLVIIDVDNPGTWRDKVLPDLPSGLVNKLETTWKWVTGPRCPADGDKHNIECQGDKCRHGEHEFNLRDAPRGMAYAVLVPGKDVIKEGHKKLMGGDVELRIRAYELIPPSLHPSGAHYEWVNPPLDEQGLLHPPIELTSEEFRQLLNVLGYGRESRQEVARVEVGVAGKRHCEEEVVIPEDRIAKAVDVIKEVYIPGHRDSILFGAIGAMWHRCVNYESARKFVDLLVNWARSTYSDENVNKDYYTLDWVYGKRGSGDENRRIWGKPRFFDAVLEAVKALNEGREVSETELRVRANEIVNEFFTALGLSTGSRKMIRISKGGKISGRNSIAYIANDPRWGIMIYYKRLPTEKRIEEELTHICEEEARRVTANIDNEEEREAKIDEYLDECVERKKEDKVFMTRLINDLAKYDYDVVTDDWYISKVRIVEDVFTGNRYYIVKFRHVKDRGRVESLDYVPLEDVVRTIIRKFGSTLPSSILTGYLNILLSGMAKEVRKPVISGIVLWRGKPRIVAYGPFREDMKELMSVTGDPKAFVELLQRWYENDPKVWDSFAIGLFQVFNFLRKQANVSGVSRNKFLLLVGDPNTGKTTIGNIITVIIFNHEKMREGPGIIYSPPRLARAVSLTTIPLFINDIKTLYADKIADMIKNLVTDYGPVYETAIPYSQSMIKYMGVSGLIITAQKFIANDIGVLDRTYEVVFTAEDVKDPRRDKERIDQFNKWLAEHRTDLMAFGRLYLETAVNEWDKVKYIILNPDYIEAAREYLRYVVMKLGAEPVYPGVEDRGEEDELSTWHIEQLTDAIKKIVEKRDPARPIIDVFNDMAKNGYIEGVDIDVNRAMYKFRRKFFGKFTEIQNLKIAYEGIKEELSKLLPNTPCLNEHVVYAKDHRGYYLGISRLLLEYLLGTSDEFTCQEGNEAIT